MPPANREGDSRRLCNQTFFTRIAIDDADELRVANDWPFEMLLTREVSTNALNWAENGDEARTPANDFVGEGSSRASGGPGGARTRI